MWTASFKISCSLLGAESTMEKRFLEQSLRHASDCCRCWKICEFLSLLRCSRMRVEAVIFQLEVVVHFLEIVVVCFYLDHLQKYKHDTLTFHYFRGGASILIFLVQS